MEKPLIKLRACKGKLLKVTNKFLSKLGLDECPF